MVLCFAYKNVNAKKSSLDVEKHKTDPIRSWTFKDESGNRVTKNGGQIIQNYYLLEILKK